MQFFWKLRRWLGRSRGTLACCQAGQACPAPVGLSPPTPTPTPGGVEILFEDGAASPNVHRVQAGDLMPEASPVGTQSGRHLSQLKAWPLLRATPSEPFGNMGSVPPDLLVSLKMPEVQTFWQWKLWIFKGGNEFLLQTRPQRTQPPTST